MKGFSYAGVEYGNQCFCGNTAALNPTTTGCTMACTGNSTEICGGSYKINVFHNAHITASSSSSKPASSASSTPTTKVAKRITGRSLRYPPSFHE